MVPIALIWAMLFQFTPGPNTVPTTIGGSGSVSGAVAFYICTGTCTVTPPAPVAGVQYCVRNDDNVATVITLAAIASVQYENTARTSYKTANTSIVSGGAVTDQICIVGRDATHYQVWSSTGTWT